MGGRDANYLLAERGSDREPNTKFASHSLPVSTIFQGSAVQISSGKIVRISSGKIEMSPFKEGQLKI
jgi:hypothetical protein